MSTTTTKTAAETTPDAPASPVLGEIVIGTQDGARVVRWTLGTRAVTRGLTVAGMAAAATATGRYLAGLDPRAVAVPPLVQISPHTWDIPLVRGHQTAVAALMTDVINAQGSIGQLPS